MEGHGFLRETSDAFFEWIKLFINFLAFVTKLFFSVDAFQAIFIESKYTDHFNLLEK